MAGFSANARVLVVHCVDTEGPIGGDVRRRSDGSKEFMDNWPDIRRSIRRLTSGEFRRRGQDSFQNPYMYNWFIMDFTGFKTNPKNRVAEYNDTYDHFKALPTQPDAFYWHYHHPPASGIGDQWSDSWGSSDEYMNILLHRLLEREDWPEAYRAGGTIEDNAASLWLENAMLIDYSNRVSDRSAPTDNIFDFNWHSAPDHWGYYHPSREDFLVSGGMRRYIVRSVDLKSRLHELTEEETQKCFAQAAQNNAPVILSYFSHDHRDMNDETKYVIGLLNRVSGKTSVPWQICNALEAVQICENMTPQYVDVDTVVDNNEVTIRMSGPIYQSKPFVGAMNADGTLCWLDVAKVGENQFRISLDGDMQKVVIGGTSVTGNKFVKSVSL